jgi:dolichol-phosphate mannosyltransferase
MKYNSLIIIPTYNEAENIEAVIKKVIDLEDKNDILVIDDNSPDGTSEIVENQKNIYNNRVFLINREKKSGLGSAYKVGFKWALENNYSYIFEMDADMSHDPRQY